MPFTITVPANAQAVSLSTTCADATVLAASATVEIRHEVTFPRLPAVTDVRALTGMLAQQRPRAVLSNEVKLADVRTAIAGEELAVWATVDDRRITPTLAEWKGASLEVFCARPGSTVIRQVIFLAQGAQGAGAAQLYQNGKQQATPPLRWTTVQRTNGGYDLLALIPLSVLQVDPATPFLFEVAVVAAPAPDADALYLTLFGSVHAYNNDSNYALVHVAQ